MRNRKLKVAALTTLDGIHANPRSFSGPYFDDEAASRSLAALESCAAMLMGRNTYEYFAPVWPKGTGTYNDRINGITKYVFSSTIKNPEWNNSQVIAGDVVSSVAKLKRQGGGDLIVYGYGKLTQTLLEHHLVDELKFLIFPVIEGTGTPLFRSGKKVPMTLVSSETLSNGTVEVTYFPA